LSFKISGKLRPSRQKTLFWQALPEFGEKRKNDMREGGKKTTGTLLREPVAEPC
jgi:hypothetical protein